MGRPKLANYISSHMIRYPNEDILFSFFFLKLYYFVFYSCFSSEAAWAHGTFVIFTTLRIWLYRKKRIWLLQNHWPSTIKIPTDSTLSPIQVLSNTFCKDMYPGYVGECSNANPCALNINIFFEENDTSIKHLCKQLSSAYQ